MWHFKHVDTEGSYRNIKEITRPVTMLRMCYTFLLMTHIAHWWPDFAEDLEQLLVMNFITGKSVSRLTGDLARHFSASTG